MGTTAGIGIGITIGIVATLAFVFLISVNPFDVAQSVDKAEINELRSLSDEDILAMEVSFDYKDILRNPEKYEGKLIHFTGEIWKVEEDFMAGPWFEVYSDCRQVSWDCGNFVVFHTGSPRLLKNDIVEFYARVDYVDNYTILGSVIPVPYVTAVRLGCVSC